jgi:phenylalanyl-tRNA synthetase alpha chain
MQEEINKLLAELKTAVPADKPAIGKRINELKQQLSGQDSILQTPNSISAIDVSAPYEPNTSVEKRPRLLSADLGTAHPLRTELMKLADIFYRMGFSYEPSREIDDDYHMFGSLNFPEGHPARDDYDTFMTTDGLIAPAHTSTMQNRVMRKYSDKLATSEDISVFVIDKAFRNEDLDITHEHTLHQIEGVYVGEGINVGNLVAVIQTFMTEYFGEKMEVKIQPFYFPFTEPSFEFAVSRPMAMRRDESEAEKWLEIGGCGMIHPNVLKEADIDPVKYSGFAWGFGLERMVMLKNGIEDIRHFNSGRIEFLRKFK